MTPEQTKNAQTIIAVGKQKGIPKKGLIVGIMAALTESGLDNVNYGDRDSLGLFQQRPSQGWGSPAQVTNPTYAAGKFFDGLKGVSGWEGMPEHLAAQAVQRSGFPDGSNYARFKAQAEEIVNGNYDAAPAAGGDDADSPGFIGQINDISGAFNRLTSPEFWKRAGIIALGAVLLGMAIIYAVSQSKTAGQIADVGLTVATRGASKAVKAVA